MKPGTIRVRLHEIGKLLPYLGQFKLKDITPKRYQDCLNDLKDRGYSDTTREGIHRTGRMIFRKVLEFGLEHDYLVFLILSYSGIRIGELIALKWKDIDFVNHTISITKTYYNPSTMHLNINWVHQRQENHA